MAANAERFAKDLAAALADIRAQGHTFLREMAGELTRRGMQTRRGGRFSVSNVKRLRTRTRALG